MLLEHHTALAARAHDRMAIAAKRAALRRIEPRDEIEQRALATTARPHKAHELALRHRQADIIKRLQPTALRVEGLADVVDHQLGRWLIEKFRARTHG